jgi:hypothetical protein
MRLFEGDEKSIPALKINNVWDMAYSVPHLVPQMLQGELHASNGRFQLSEVE